MTRVGLALAAVTATGVAARPMPGVKIMGITTIPADADPSGAPVGGVSGIDYDPRSKTWVMISDDKSEHAEARFWQARIEVRAEGPPKVKLSAATPIRTAAGLLFPRPGIGQEAIDAESIRFQPDGRLLTWLSEGDARDGFGPAIRQMDRSGRFASTIPLPDSFNLDPEQRRGPRPNLSIEGLSYAPDGKALWLSLEAPLFQDGPVASRQEGADIRLTRLVPGSSAPPVQYAYRLDPIGPVPEGRLSDNGVSEILSIDARHLLVIERSGLKGEDGAFRFRPRLYCASLGNASDVSGIDTLAGAQVRHVTKRLIFAFDEGRSGAIDNVEGMAWGPPLANGHRSLVFVTDNDFSEHRKTQVIMLDAGELGQSPERTTALCDTGSE
ncbi:esterase-like activity of phytase family protein [Sphingobium sp. CR2-8]|uniref:esterase-like activity of phytase family protein n=1 Tax=Sphingobium sp. CR2-8 TaxID=1306534 RepID=UPI002DB73B2B|nr:esterase-like activity of phytase family protein [Sphingobium sp. CR2-8]MEC3909798.1 esterase-like activity of phytase family protein [Sphingobium sp. CR2-8]